MPTAQGEFYLLLQRRLVHPAVHHIMRDAHLHTRRLRVTDLAHAARGRSGPELAIGDFLILGQERARREHRVAADAATVHHRRSEEHTSELQSLMRISYAV